MQHHIKTKPGANFLALGFVCYISTRHKAVTDFFSSGELGQENRQRFSRPKTPLSFGLDGIETGCKGDTDFLVLVGFDLRWTVILSLITAAPVKGALMLGLRSTRPEMTSGRPLRNTAVVRYAPALRARAEALRSPPGSDHCLLLFQLAGPITTDQYKRGVQDSVTSADGQPARG